MSPFAWFVAIITVAYGIYYTVMIMNDLYGKKSERKENAEEIDVPAAGDAIPDESPIEVRECDTGFSVGKKEYVAAVAVSEESVEEKDHVPVAEKAEEPPMLEGENLQNKIEDITEEIQPQFSNPYGSVDFREQLVLEKGDLSQKPVIEKKKMFDEI